MSDEFDLETVIEQHQARIEHRVREQIARHHRIDPTIDPKRIVEIQIRQEREDLEQRADRLEENNNDVVATVLRDLAGEWLAELEHRLKFG